MTQLRKLWEDSPEPAFVASARDRHGDHRGDRGA